MALFNKTKREINAKIVYFGPSFAGKTTSLQFIHRKLKPEHRGAIKTMGGQQDRMLFFDFMPPELGEVNGFRVRFHLYTVQGEVTNASTWKTVLKGADGIVFAADASSERIAAGKVSMENLREYLKSYGQALHDLPVVLQCSKSDLSSALPPEEIARLLNASGMEAVKSSNKSGEGVLQALSLVVKQVLKGLREQESEGDALVDVSGVEPSEPVVRMHQEDEIVISSGIVEEEVPPVALRAAGPEGVCAEPDLAIAGPAEVTHDGKCRIPLAIVCGERERRYVLTVFLTEDGQG